MKEQNTHVTYTRSELDALPDETDWERVDALTDEDIEKAALSDPDDPPTDADFWKDATVVMPENMEEPTSDMPIERRKYMDLSTPFDESQIPYYASEYPSEYDDPVKDIKKHLINQNQRYLSLSDLKVVGKWKVKKERNTMRNIIKNSETRVIEITSIALSPDTCERERIKSLKCLDGVGSAVASAILHWFHEDPYPIWDRFARRALGFNPNQGEPRSNEWEDYTSLFRGIMERQNANKRTLDRALWVFGKQCLDTRPICGNIP